MQTVEDTETTDIALPATKTAILTGTVEDTEMTVMATLAGLPDVEMTEVHLEIMVEVVDRHITTARPDVTTMIEVGETDIADEAVDELA